MAGLRLLHAARPIFALLAKAEAQRSFATQEKNFFKQSQRERWFSVIFARERRREAEYFELISHLSAKQFHFDGAECPLSGVKQTSPFALDIWLAAQWRRFNVLVLVLNQCFVLSLWGAMRGKAHESGFH